MFRAATPPSRPTVASPAAVEAGRQEATRRRFRQLADQLERYRKKTGRYPEFDDAARLEGALSLAEKPVDGWGRRPSYLTLGGGSRYVLASGGADGRLSHPLEAYLRGANPGAGRRADIVLVNGRLVD